MTTALVASGQTDVAIAETLERLNTVRAVLAPDLNDSELRLFAMVAARSGLDPFAKQIYAVKRAGRVTFQTGIDGYRSGAEKTREYAGSDEPEYSPNPCPCGREPRGHPEWARVTVYRREADGSRRGQSATAYFDEFLPGPPNDAMWKKMPRNQLAKCAEALAFRKAFPYVLADVYVTEEMDQADAQSARLAEAQRVATLPTAADRLAARRAAIEVPSTASPSSAAADAAPSGDGESDDSPSAAAEEPRAVAGEVLDAPTSLCGSPSPFTQGAVCVLELGHERNHRSANRETWSPGR